MSDLSTTPTDILGEKLYRDIERRRDTRQTKATSDKDYAIRLYRRYARIVMVNRGIVLRPWEAQNKTFHQDWIQSLDHLDGYIGSGNPVNRGKLSQVFRYGFAAKDLRLLGPDDIHVLHGLHKQTVEDTKTT